MNAHTSTERQSISAWLWPYMADLYGNAWNREHGIEDERGTWGQALARLHPAQIKQALADCLRHYPDWPPTLGQFRALAKMAPNPDAPKQLAPPKSEAHENNAQWLEDIQAMMAEAKNSGPMTEEQRQYHLRVLGMDEASEAKKAEPWIEPASKAACAYPGCYSPGAIAQHGGSHWYCRKHFRSS